MFVAVSYALGAARKAIILLGATKVLFDGVLPFFILKGAGKAGYWLGWFPVCLSCLIGGRGKYSLPCFAALGVELWGLVVFLVVVGKAILYSGISFPWE
jgi:hypothetical protein